jgi:hypothetical protein
VGQGYTEFYFSVVPVRRGLCLLSLHGGGPIGGHNGGNGSAILHNVIAILPQKTIKSGVARTELLAA